MIFITIQLHFIMFDICAAKTSSNIPCPTLFIFNVNIEISKMFLQEFHDQLASWVTWSLMFAHLVSDVGRNRRQGL